VDLVSWYAIVIGAADLLIVVGLGYRIVMRRRPTGVTLAWLIILTLAPFLGAFFYLLLGESRLGRCERAGRPVGAGDASGGHPQAPARHDVRRPPGAGRRDAPLRAHRLRPDRS